MEKNISANCGGGCASCHEGCGEHASSGPSKLEETLYKIGDMDEDQLLRLLNEAMGVTEEA